MAELFYHLFYIFVLALVASCVAYLVLTRDPSGPGPGQAGSGGPAPPSREAAREARRISGSYRLSDLERVLLQFAATGAWGMVLEVAFTTVQEDIQMTVEHHAVTLHAPYLGEKETEPFRRAANEAGLEPRTTDIEGQYYVDVTGIWPEIARRLRGIMKSMYGVEDREEVQIRVIS